MTGLRIVVPGAPVPQGSKSAKVVGRRAVLYDDNAAKLKPWRKLVTLAAVNAMTLGGHSTLDEPVVVEALFVFERPASVRRLLPAVKPDLDKLLRAAFDGLTDAAVFVDDSRVTDIVTRKRYGSPARLELTIRPAGGAS